MAISISLKLYWFWDQQFGSMYFRFSKFTTYMNSSGTKFGSMYFRFSKFTTYMNNQKLN
jgi:hypothetical protein